MKTEDKSVEVEDEDKQGSGEKEEEEEEDEVPSLPLGVTGISCPLFYTCAKIQGLTLSSRASCSFQISFTSWVFEYWWYDTGSCTGFLFFEIYIIYTQSY